MTDHDRSSAVPVVALPAPYYADDSVTLHNGDALAVLRTLPPTSVNCIVTSPPYFGLRDYGIDGQYGLEDSPAEYVARMVAVFAEARRVLASDGTFWLNLGDSYVSVPGSQKQGANGEFASRAVAQVRYTKAARGNTARRPKNMLGIPWRVAFALQDDGWILRNAIVWHKPNAMPESVTDRLSCDYELVFLFSRSRRYWFDLDPIREPLAYPAAADGTRKFGGANKGTGEGTTGAAARRGGLHPSVYGGPDGKRRERNRGGRTDGLTIPAEPGGVGGHENGRNPGSVWDIPTQPFPEAHFAVMPTALAQRCIAAGCKPGGVVLDPFSGSGTTGAAAARLGRRYVGIDLNPEYLDLSLKTRLAQPGFVMDNEPEAVPDAS